MERVKKGYRCGIIMELIFSVAVSIIVFFAAAPLMKMFVAEDSAEVVALGVHNAGNDEYCTGLLQGNG